MLFYEDNNYTMHISLSFANLSEVMQYACKQMIILETGIFGKFSLGRGNFPLSEREFLVALVKIYNVVVGTCGRR
jgi:hypothetical protein